MSVEMEHWREIKQIVQDALVLPLAQRSAHLDEACDNDEEVRSAVEALLAVTETRAEAFDDLSFSPSAQQVTLAPGDQFEDWLIVRELPGGGMSWVFLAEEPALSRRVVLKFVMPHAAHISAYEHEVLGRFQDEGIASVYATGKTADGIRYIVMEYVDGNPITSVCREESLSLSERLRLFQRVCVAVQTAHQKGVIHRDLKPSNILVTSERKVKVLDFGIAMRLDLEVSPTTVGPQPATVAYASPEQLAGRATDARTDVYSLGLLLRELLTGKVPSMLRAADARQVIPPSTLVSDQYLAKRLRGDLDAIVSKALRLSASERYSSVDALGDDVERYLQHESVHAREGTPAYRAGKFLRRHRFSTSLVALVFLAFVGAFVWVLKENRETLKERDRARIAAERAERVSAFMVDVFEKANPRLRQQTVVTAEELLEEAKEGLLNGTLEEQPDIRVTFLDTLGQAFDGLGKHAEAAELFGQAVLEGEKLQTIDPKILLSAQIHQAGALMLAGDLEGAVTEGHAALALAEASLDTESTMMAQVLQTLGVIYWQRAEYETSRLHYEWSLEIRRSQQIPDPEELATTLFSLAVLASTTGRYEEAGRLFHESVAIFRRLHPGGHVDLASSLHSFAVFHHRRGNRDDAERLYRESLDMSRAGYNSSHPSIGRTLGALGALLREAGRYDEAEAVLFEAYEIIRTTLGPEHRSYASVLHNRAAVQKDLGNYDAAERLERDVIAIYESQFGQEHPRVAGALGVLGSILHKQGKFAEAEQAHRRALAIRRTALPDKHHDIANSLSNLAAAIKMQARFEEAERYYREALEVLRSKDSPHLLLPGVLNNLGSLLRDQGRLGEARAIVDEGLALAIELRGDDHVTTAVLRMSSARLSNLQGSYSEALPMLEHSHDTLVAKLPLGHRLHAYRKSVLGQSLVGLGELDRAEELLLSALAATTKIEGENSSNARFVLKTLVSLYEVSGEEAEASRYRAHLKNR